MDVHAYQYMYRLSLVNCLLIVCERYRAVARLLLCAVHSGTSSLVIYNDSRCLHAVNFTACNEQLELHRGCYCSHTTRVLLQALSHRMLTVFTQLQLLALATGYTVHVSGMEQHNGCK
jgi:hypothetical protein